MTILVRMTILVGMTLLVRVTILVGMTLLSLSGRGTRLGLRHRQEAFTLRELARGLLSPADTFLLLARATL
jgi:hypothetical protein